MKKVIMEKIHSSKKAPLEDKGAFRMLNLLFFVMKKPRSANECIEYIRHFENSRSNTDEAVGRFIRRCIQIFKNTEGISFVETFPNYIFFNYKTSKIMERFDYDYSEKFVAVAKEPLSYYVSLGDGTSRARISQNLAKAMQLEDGDRVFWAKKDDIIYLVLSTQTDEKAFEVFQAESANWVNSRFSVAYRHATGELKAQTVFINPNVEEIDNLTCFRVENSTENNRTDLLRELRKKRSK